jgi:crossover junction endodeoxyribonuclease RuvC
MRGGGDETSGRLRVLGVDPGTAVTGWGVVERAGGRVAHLGHGTVRIRRGVPLTEKLAAVHRGLAECCGRWRPAVLALEKSFVGPNVQSAFRLGEVRGVAMLAAAAAGLPVVEYSPAEVKLAVVGTGRADKSQVARAIARELVLGAPLAADAADALAIALCHLYTGRLRALVAGRGASVTR